jgi:hypothetical protein
VEELQEATPATEEMVEITIPTEMMEMAPPAMDQAVAEVVDAVIPFQRFTVVALEEAATAAW